MERPAVLLPGEPLTSELAEFVLADHLAKPPSVSSPDVGGVYTPRSLAAKRGRPLYVVYLVKANESVFFDALNKTLYASAGACCGPGASSRFLAQYEKVGQMTFGGAWKRYQQERARSTRNAV